jgi:tetratricopeptide (TPR) repeat protein
MRGARVGLGVLLATALVAEGTPAAAAGSVWSRARSPDAERRRELVAEAQGHELKAQTLVRSRNQLDRAEVTVHLAQATILLEEAGAATSSDLFLRYRLALVYTSQDEQKKAIPILESIVRADPPAALRAMTFSDLAVAYAHQGRIGDEIAAYGEALRVQPVAFERSRLLANRAEAYMLLGDITPAVQGYRAALALLSADHMMFGTGPTTLWGLAVALDRSGDLDSGLDAVRLARTYDPQDKLINGPAWFYLPDYDRHWYEALGHWQVARKTDALLSVRVDAYARASASWDEYVTNAARDDRWLPLARLRAKQCEKERAAFLRRPGVATTQPSAPPLGRPYHP